jgi:FKBP-type peptidyl-prolyl cis-trans isomerase FkpA
MVDSTFKRGKPVEVNLRETLPCLRSALLNVHVGAKARVTCPPATAFGDAGRPPVILMGQAVSFVVDVLGIKESAQASH